MEALPEGLGGGGFLRSRHVVELVSQLIDQAIDLNLLVTMRIEEWPSVDLEPLKYLMDPFIHSTGEEMTKPVIVRIVPLGMDGLGPVSGTLFGRVVCVGDIFPGDSAAEHPTTMATFLVRQLVVDTASSFVSVHGRHLTIDPTTLQTGTLD